MSELRIKGNVNGNVAAVNSEGKLQTRAITVSNASHHSDHGDYYNFNTGNLTLTDGSESAVMYLKYTGTRTFKLSTFILGVGTLDAPSESAIITMVRNPTVGTIVSNALPLPIDGVNLNFASNKVMGVDVYKGAQGDTITDGTDVALFYATGSSRAPIPLDFTMPQGTSVGISVQLNNANGGDIYIALNGYEEEVED